MITKLQRSLKSAILKKELRLEKEDDLHKWATREAWKATPDLSSFARWSLEQMKVSDAFFELKPIQNFKKTGNRIEFDSPIQTLTPENNRVSGDFFKSKGKRAAVLILGHWNAGKSTYNRLAKIYSLHGISALRMSLPYHDERRPHSMPIASGLLSSDLNLTVQSMQQSVLEARMAVSWLQEQGYVHIGVVGASLGSAIALLASCHDSRIEAMVGYLTAAEIADIVWHGSATRHLREVFDQDFKLEQLRDAWSCVSPGNYLEKLVRPRFSMHVGWARYDTVCPTRLTKGMLARLRRLKVPVSSASYACGHNTLASAPFIYTSGLRGIYFMRKKLLS